MAAALSSFDPCSFAEPDICTLKHIHVNLEIDFSSRILKGTAKLGIEKKSPEAETVLLDTRDLKIHRVTLDENGQELKYSLGEPVLSFGSKLEVQVPTSTAQSFTINIEYETSPNSTALQWLKKEQTAGKEHPYLFSQCQAIHARSLLPCQDTPGVKMPYTAEISAVSELTVLMSAVRQGTEASTTRPGYNVHKFSQTVPIPSYLIAIVAGALQSKDIGPRSKVWTEASMLEAAAYEFAETETMLKTAEDLLGPYVWGVYDLLVLPPSFPYGGMENPCLTFVTPTLLAGDRSLADVVAHEITHSWTGNLVTNKTPEHFWLNEGHTVFVERKIGGRMHSEKHRHFETAGGYKELEYTVKDVFGVEHPYTHLVPNIVGVDPDDVFSTVPYEKGSNLLFYLEQLVGGPEVFEPFLRAYIEKFKYQSITTDDWKDFLLSFFKEKVDQGVFDEVNWDAWFYKPGMPPVKPNYDTSLADACTELRKRWVESMDSDVDKFVGSDLEEFSTVQVREFLAQLQQQDPLSRKKINRMEESYQFNQVKNSEIRFRWLRLCLRAHVEEAIQGALGFVNEQGRLKFVRPIYRDLYNWEKARPDAIANYKATKDSMHILAATMIGKDLKLVQ